MDQISYMNRYTIVIESMQEFDCVEDTAMESVNKDVENIEADYTQKYAQYIADFQSAIDSKDRQGALKALDNVDKLLGETLKQMQELPQDKFIGIRKLAKIALAIVGLYLTFKSGKIYDVAKNLLSKMPLPGIVNKVFGGIAAKTPEKLAKFGGKAAKFAGTMAIGDVGTKQVFRGAKEIMNDIKAGSRKEFEEKYGKNPNAASNLYRKFYLALQSEKAAIPQLKQEVNQYFAQK